MTRLRSSKFRLRLPGFAVTSRRGRQGKAGFRILFPSHLGPPPSRGKKSLEVGLYNAGMTTRIIVVSPRLGFSQSFSVSSFSSVVKNAAFMETAH